MASCTYNCLKHIVFDCKYVYKHDVFGFKHICSTHSLLTHIVCDTNHVYNTYWLQAHEHHILSMTSSMCLTQSAYGFNHVLPHNVYDFKLAYTKYCLRLHHVYNIYCLWLHHMYNIYCLWLQPCSNTLYNMKHEQYCQDNNKR